MASGQTAWLSMTGQKWKLAVFLLLMAIAGAALAAVIWMSQHGAADGSEGGLVAWALTGVLGMLVAFLWLTLSLRCPGCRANVGWSVLRTISASQWLTALLTIQVCPACGRVPEPVAKRPKRPVPE